MPRVYPQRVLDLIEDELYEELEDLDEEAAINEIEDAQRKKEDLVAEKMELADQQALLIPAGVTFDPVAHLDNLPPLRNGIACTSSENGLDNLPLAPLFQGRQWPFL